MTRSAAMYLYEERIGSVIALDGDYTLMTFDDAYLADPDRPVLSQAFIGIGGPVRQVPRTHTVAPPFLANLLPERGSALRKLIARQYRINEFRDHAFLIALGSDLPGAIAIRDDEAPPEPSDVTSSASAGPSRIRFSLAGAQLKFSASVVDRRFRVSTVDECGEVWICKLPTNEYPRLPENESFVMDLARSIGLDVPPTRLVPLDEIDGIASVEDRLRDDEPRVAYAIRRFDRDANGGRRHVEDLNQVFNQPPDGKYDNHSSSNVANVVATLCPPADIDEFVRRLVFGLCVGNDDMHLKNWALVYPDRRTPRLAPMYDFVCTRRYLDASRPTLTSTLALSVGGEQDAWRVDRDALERFAAKAALSTNRTLRVVSETIAALRERWPAFRDRAENVGLRDTLERQMTFSPLFRLRHRARSPAERA